MKAIIIEFLIFTVLIALICIPLDWYFRDVNSKELKSMTGMLIGFIVADRIVPFIYKKLF